MSTNAYEEMLEYLDGQRKKLAGMRERLDEPGVEKQYEACLKAYRDLKNSLDWAQWKFSGDKHKSLQVDTERTFHQRYPLAML